MSHPDNQNKKGGRALLVCAIIFVALFAIINIGAITSFFSAIFSVISPIIIGAGIAYILNPLLKLYEFKVFKKIPNKNVCRGLSLFMTFFSAVLAIVLFVWLLIPSLVESIASLVDNLDEYLETATLWINNVINRYASHEDFRHYVDEEAIINGVTKAVSSSGNLFETVLGYVKTVGVGLITALKNLVLSIFIAVYMLISKERITAQFRKLTTAIFPGKSRRVFRRYLRLANRTFGDYFIGVLVDACFVMMFSLVVFLIFGIPHALFISVIVGVTNIIPIFGPFIGGIPSFLIIFLADPKKAILFVVLILIIQQIDGNIIAPKILGTSTKLSSLGVIIAITIMGAYFGLVGMIIGVPFFSMIVAIGTELINTRLKKHDFPTDTAHYYTNDSLVDPTEHHEPFAAVLGRTFKQIGGKIKKFVLRLLKKEIPADEPVTDATESTETADAAEQSTES